MGRYVNHNCVLFVIITISLIGAACYITKRLLFVVGENECGRLRESIARWPTLFLWAFGIRQTIWLFYEICCVEYSA